MNDRIIRENVINVGNLSFLFHMQTTRETLCIAMIVDGEMSSILQSMGKILIEKNLSQSSCCRLHHRFHNWLLHNENATYTQHTEYVKDCYLCGAIVNAEKCSYARGVNYVDYVVDTYYATKSSIMYESLDIV